MKANKEKFPVSLHIPRTLLTVTSNVILHIHTARARERAILRWMVEKRFIAIRETFFINASFVLFFFLTTSDEWNRRSGLYFANGFAAFFLFNDSSRETRVDVEGIFPSFFEEVDSVGRISRRKDANYFFATRCSTWPCCEMRKTRPFIINLRRQRKPTSAFARSSSIFSYFRSFSLVPYHSRSVFLLRVPSVSRSAPTGLMEFRPTLPTFPSFFPCVPFVRVFYPEIPTARRFEY